MLTLRQCVALLLIVLLIAGLGGCGVRQRAMQSADVQGASAPPSAPDALGRGETKQMADEAPAAAADRKIITTGQMTIQVRELDAALEELGRLVRRSGGFFANRNVTAEEDWRRAEVTIRVPSNKFDALHEGAQALGEVKRDELQGEDVTKQWQDLQARIKIRQAEEQALMRLMQQQARLADLLEVEKRLWEVREQIEQAQGELRFLRDRVTLATLTISLNEEVPAGVGKIAPWNLKYHVVNAAQALVRAIQALITALIYIALPGAIVWVPLLLLILWIRRRLRRRREQRAERSSDA